MNLDDKPFGSSERLGNGGPTHRPLPHRFWKRSRFWLIPTGLLGLCLGTAAAFFWAAEHQHARLALSGPREPAAGGTFRFPLTDERLVRTLDPARAVSADEIMLIQQIYDGLTAFDQHLNIVPALARYWEISPDGKTYTFELRQNAKFHDGSPVTAEDCVFSFQRLLTPGLNEPNYHYYSRIVGADEFRAGKNDHVSGLRAPTKRTFQIEFTTPFVPALSVFSMYSSKILPKSLVEERGQDFFTAPIGTGPFRFSHWTSPEEDPAIPVFRGVAQGLRLEANPSYFAGRPYLDAVVFRSAYNVRGSDDDRPLNELVDCFETPVEHYRDWVAIETEKLLTLNYLILPTNIPPFDKPEVRRAINYALDKRSFLDASPLTMGSPAATGIVPPGIPGFYSPLEPPYKHNLEKARKLLALAGYPQGRGLPPLETVVSRRDVDAPRRECLMACMSNIGIEIRPLKARRLSGLDDPRLTARPVVFPHGWSADFPDPDNFLRPLFHSESQMNRSGYENPEVDRLLDLAWSETSYKERNDLYRRIEEMILLDSPIVPLDNGRSRFLARPNVRGFTLSPMGAAYIKMNEIWLEPDEVSAGS